MAKKNKAPQEEDFVRVTMHTESDGVVAYIDAKGTVLAYKLPKTGTVADLRVDPKFLAISPCPYCGAVNNRGHILSQHTDPFLGTPLCCTNDDHQLIPCKGKGHHCSYFDVVTRKKIQ